MSNLIGARVKFTNTRDYGDGLCRIDNAYHTEESLSISKRHLIEHGLLVVLKNQGIIKDIDTHKNIYLIEYVDRREKKVCLGFKREAFEIQSWRVILK